MAVGAIAPWATALAISVSGLDTDDGPIILGGAVIAGISLLLHARSRHRGWAGLSLLCGIVGFAGSFYDRSNISHLTSDSAGLARVGWGLNITVVASAILAVASLALLLDKPDAVNTTPTRTIPPSQPVVTPLPPAGWYVDPLGVAELRYWSGESWTEHTHTALPVASSPSPEPQGTALSTTATPT
jgi:hypothetical protein